MAAHRQLRRSVVHARYLAPLVHHRHTLGGAILRAVGQAADHIPQQCGLAQPRRRQDHRGAKPTVLPQLRQHRSGYALLLPANADADGGQVTQVAAVALPHHRRAAHADAEAAGRRQIALPQRIGDGIAGIACRHVAQLLQIGLRHTGDRLLLRGPHLPLRQQHRHGLSGSQPQLLRPCLLVIRQLPGQPLPFGRQQQRRLFIP